MLRIFKRKTRYYSPIPFPADPTDRDIRRYLEWKRWQAGIYYIPITTIAHFYARKDKAEIDDYFDRIVPMQMENWNDEF